jgi:hypothetical protein
MHGGAAKWLPFFSGKDAQFICAVVPFLKNRFHNPDDYVYHKKDYADEVYFIVKGRINYVYGEKNLCYKSL